MRYVRGYVYYSKTIANARNLARNYWQIRTALLHRTIKSNAMVVDTTCMQAGPVDPRAGAYD